VLSLTKEEIVRKVLWFVGITIVVALSFAFALAVYARVSTSGPLPDGSQLVRAQAANPRAVSDLPAIAPAAASPRLAETPPPAPDVILQNALIALAGLNSWHVELGMDVIGSFRSVAVEAPVSYSGDFNAPDRLEGTVSVQLMGLVLEKDTVFLANTRQEGDDASVSVGSLFSLLSFGRFEISDIQNMELVGEETLAGTQVYHLKGELAADKNPSGLAHQSYGFQGGLRFDAWIGVADSLPRQVMADGQVTMEGAAEGTLQIGASVNLSEFGQAAAITPATPSLAPEDAGCAEVGEGFVAYRDEAQGIRFCYPAGWVVNNLVTEHGFIALSPEGVGDGRPLPKSLLVIYPPASVSGFGNWRVGAVEAVARPAVAFYNWIRQSVQPGDTSGKLVLNFQTITRIGQWVLSDGQLVAGLTGSEYSSQRALSLGGTVQGDSQGSIVEAILSSVAVERDDSP
jgi:hypothetical protein